MLINKILPAILMNLRIKDMRESERPRERLLRLGGGSLSDAELLALILRTGCIEENAITMAARLLKRFPLYELAGKRISQLRVLRGIGVAKACQLVAAFELGKRASAATREKLCISSSSDAIEFLQPEMEDYDKEHFIILMLDTRNNLIRKETIFIGTLNNSIIHPREIFKPAIIESAASLILSHNHPSGDPAPSEDDIEVTRKLKEAGKIIGIDILDHVIIGRGRSYSLLDNGML